MAMTGIELFALIAGGATLFALGFVPGEAAGEWCRGDDAGSKAVGIVNSGGGDVEVTFGD